jgi:hypothetical protein
MNKKSKLGQFFTTNYEYILQGFPKPDIQHIIEPFVGNGDILKWLKDISIYTLEMYDIDPKIENTIVRDTITFPPSYTNKFVLTNPPYIARNKNKNKDMYDLYNENDLYKCFLRTLINEPPEGGIIIIPLNFLCSIRKQDCKLRHDFLQVFSIISVNIFEETVFKDTTCTICSIYFSKDNIKKTQVLLNIKLFPNNIEKTLVLTENNYWLIGGDIYNLKSTNYKIVRKTENDDIETNTRMTVYTIDGGCKNNRICLKYDRDYVYIGKNTSRTVATLHIYNKILSEEEQIDIVNRFNILLEERREMYNSLFLSNYRESKEYARKRISFDLVYNIVSSLL